MLQLAIFHAVAMQYIGIDIPHSPTFDDSCRIVGVRFFCIRFDGKASEEFS